MLGNRQGGRERGRGRGSLCVTQVSLFPFQMKKEQKGIKRGGKQGVQQLFPGIAGSGEVGKVEPKKADRALHQYTFPLLSVPWPFHSFGRASCTCSSLFLHVVTLLSCFSRVELISGHKRLASSCLLVSLFFQWQSVGLPLFVFLAFLSYLQSHPSPSLLSQPIRVLFHFCFRLGQG